MAESVLDEQVVKAVLALQCYGEKQPKPKKGSLLPENSLLWMLVALKKIPEGPHRPIRIPLPHALKDPKETEVCLFTKHNKKTTKEKLAECNVTFIDKVIPVDKLKKEYNTFERKRVLCSSFGVFLADARVYGTLQGLLGKTFYSRKKFPFPVHITRKNLKLRLEQAITSTYVTLGLGQCVAIPVGRVSLTPEQVTANVQAILTQLPARLPGGWKTVQSVHLKMHTTVALPLYKCLPDLPTTVQIEGSSQRLKRKRPAPSPSTVEPLEKKKRTKEEDVEVDDVDDSVKAQLTPSNVEEHPAKRSKTSLSSKSSKSSSVASLRIRGSRVKRRVSHKL